MQTTATSDAPEGECEDCERRQARQRQRAHESACNISTHTLDFFEHMEQQMQVHRIQGKDISLQKESSTTIEIYALKT